VARGRRLRVPPAGTRPTSDRAREGLFSTLGTLRPVTGARMLDLYAGSGAVGLEALSRGAAAALLVEADPRAVRVLRDNVDTLGLPGAVVRAEPVERVLAAECPAEPYDIVFLDPPYAVPVEPVLLRLVAGGWAGDVVVVERRTGTDVGWPAGILPVRARRYGEATLCYGRRS
jgi:16S rRNA (guanine966-N2)-methyltransferase